MHSCVMLAVTVLHVHIFVPFLGLTNSMMFTVRSEKVTYCLAIY